MNQKRHQKHAGEARGQVRRARFDAVTSYVRIRPKAVILPARWLETDLKVAPFRAEASYR